MKFIRQLVKKTVKLFMTILTFLVKVDNELIVLESNPPLQDNTGALFKKMLELNLNLRYKIVWLMYENKSDRESFENVRYVYIDQGGFFKKIKGYFISSYWISKSKFYIFSHRKNYVSPIKKGQRIVNLTHGIPIKDSSNRHMLQNNVSDIITTSEYGGELRAYTYGINTDKIRVTGYPRNDLLFRNKETDFGDYIVWLPTYRTHKNDQSKDENDNFPLSPTKKDLIALDRKLKKLNLCLFIKPHPAQKLILDSSLYSNIILISDDFLKTNKIHLYQFLADSLALITDYSSVYLDYLLTDNPIIFTFDDLTEYSHNWGFTVDDIQKVTPGEKVLTVDELIIAIENVRISVDGFGKDREMVRNLFHKYQDDKSSERLLEYLDIK